MHLKRFSGPRLPDVLRRVREELGPDAVILHTNSSRPRGLLQFFRGARVEVLAAVDRTPGPGPRAPATAARTSRGSRTAGIAPSPRAGNAAITLECLHAQVTEVRDLLIRFAGARTVSPAHAVVYQRLLAAGVEEVLALRIVGELQATREDQPTCGSAGGPPADGVEALERALSRVIRVAAPPPGIRAAVVAVVGPAGTGKTTTLAKLAAAAHLAGGRVEIVSLADGALGAPNPIESFATILGARYTLAGTPGDLARVEEGGPARGLVLIDTPGLNPRDQASVAGLERLLRVVARAETHVVLSATSRPADAIRTVSALAPLGLTHLLFTRLDETTGPGTVLSVAAETGLPLSYFGTGREVPDGIRRATAGELARRVLEGEHHR